VSVIVGVLVWFFAVDPHFPPNKAGLHAAPVHRKSALDEAKELLKEAKSIIQIPTFQVFVAQGVSGSFPWSALSFLSMWLELIGFTHEQTSVFTTIFAVATSIGGLLGGKMGDFLAQRYPNAGRIILSQISAGPAIPLGAVLLLGLPDEPSRSSSIAHGLDLFIMGLVISWNGAATNWYDNSHISKAELKLKTIHEIPRPIYLRFYHASCAAQFLPRSYRRNNG
jgi:MFS family permease